MKRQMAQGQKGILVFKDWAEEETEVGRKPGVQCENTGKGLFKGGYGQMAEGQE